MTSLVRHITFDCVGDPHQLAFFWSQVVGRPVDPDDKPGDPEVIIWGGDGVPNLLFIRVPEGKNAAPLNAPNPLSSDLVGWRALDTPILSACRGPFSQPSG